MSEVCFEWDFEKNKANQKKHGISFEEAVTVFYDNNAILFDDPDHSIAEERFLLIGFSVTAKLCIVSHCYREGDVIRIISARKATAKETKYYSEENGGK